jgi:hypothetical protein
MVLTDEMILLLNSIADHFQLDGSLKLIDQQVLFTIFNIFYFSDHSFLRNEVMDKLFLKVLHRFFVCIEDIDKMKMKFSNKNEREVFQRYFDQAISEKGKR